MNIEQLILITLCLYLLYAVVVIVRSVVALWRVSSAVHRARLILRDGGASDSNDRHSAGVSVAVVGRLSAVALEERLSLEYPISELIWVAPLREVGGAEQILDRYDMASVDFISSEGLMCRGVEGLYRSRSRRYRRLVIVDCCGTTADCYNAAVEVAGYDLLLPLDTRTHLSPASLTLMVESALESSEGWVASFAANMSVGEHLAFAERLLLLTAGGGRNERIGGRVVTPIYLFRRDAVLAEGGFVDGGVVVEELARRVRLRGGGSVLPLLLGSVRSAEIEPRSLRNPITGRYYTPVLATQLSALWIVAMALSAPFEGSLACGVWLIGVVWLVGVVRTTLAAAALLMLSEITNTVPLKSVGCRRIIFFSFLRVRDIMSPKNFVK